MNTEYRICTRYSPGATASNDGTAGRYAPLAVRVYIGESPTNHGPAPARLVATDGRILTVAPGIAHSTTSTAAPEPAVFNLAAKSMLGKADRKRGEREASVGISASETTALTETGIHRTDNTVSFPPWGECNDTREGSAVSVAFNPLLLKRIVDSLSAIGSKDSPVVRLTFVPDKYGNANRAISVSVGPAPVDGTESGAALLMPCDPGNPADQHRAFVAAAIGSAVDIARASGANEVRA